MKFLALFALLPLLAQAAPLNLGPVTILPGVQNPKVPTVPAIPALPTQRVPSIPTVPTTPNPPSQVGATLGQVLALGSDGNGPLGAVVGVTKPDNVVATVGGILANATVAANATLTNGIVGSGNDNVLVEAGKNAQVLVNGTIGAFVAPLSTDTPSQVLAKLSGYIVSNHPVVLREARGHQTVCLRN